LPGGDQRYVPLGGHRPAEKKTVSKKDWGGGTFYGKSLFPRGGKIRVLSDIRSQRGKKRRGKKGKKAH